jgi:hypothetical protein
MLTLRPHNECPRTGSQPASAPLCAQGWSKVQGGRQGYACAIVSLASVTVGRRTPAIGFPMNPEADR